MADTDTNTDTDIHKVMQLQTKLDEVGPVDNRPSTN